MTATKFPIALALVFLLAGLVQPRSALALASQDVMVVFDLPADVATPELLGETVTKIGNGLSAGGRLGVVSADRPGGRLVTALVPTAEVAGKLGSSPETPTVAQATERDPAAALERALYEIRITGRSDAQRVVVFIGDGNTGVAEDRREWMRGSLVQEAKRNAVRAYVIAWGNGADIEFAQTLSRTTRGEYFRANSPQELSVALQKVTTLLPQDAVGAVPAPTVADQTTADVVSVHAAPEADRWAGWFLAALVGAGALLGGIASYFIAKFHAPQAGRGAVRATPNAYLVDLHGLTPLSRYVLGTRPVIIGRVAGKDTRQFDYITVPINTVSRRHAVIEYRDGAYWVLDQGSINGTRVNDKRIKGKRRLEHGDRIGLHRCELQFELSEEAGDRTVVEGDTQTQTMTTQAGMRAVASETVALTVVESALPEQSSNDGNDRTVVLSPDNAGAAAIPIRKDSDRPPAAVTEPRPKMGSLDSFISTTLIENEEKPGLVTTLPDPPPGSFGAFETLDTSVDELSIEEFLAADGQVGTDQDPLSATTSTSSSAHLSTMKLEETVAESDAEEFRLGDTISLFEPPPGQAEPTTPLEQFLREHITGEHHAQPAADDDDLSDAWGSHKP